MTDKRFERKLAKIKKQGERYKQEAEVREAYERYMPEKKTKKVSNVMLVVIVLAIVVFTAASFALQYYTGVEISSTLVGCWFTFWGTEIIALAAIKVTKTKRVFNDESVDNEPSNEEDICG